MATPKPLGLDGLDNLGIDEFNRLYWKGELLATKTMIMLPDWINIALGTAAVLGSIHIAIMIADRFGWLPAKGSPATRQTSSPDASGGCSDTQTPRDTSEDAEG